MKIYLFIFLFLLPFYAQAQTNLPVGQGILKIDFEKAPALQFFIDTLQKESRNTVSVVKDQREELIIQTTGDKNNWFIPEQLFLEYGIFIIRVDTAMGNWYKVFVNNETATALWIKADEAKRFIKWPAFLLKETTAVDLASTGIDIKATPSEKAATIKKMEKKDCFEVLEIKGDWMKIRTNTQLECSETNRPVKSGWIKWRDKNRLMIGYSLSC